MMKKTILTFTITAIIFVILFSSLVSYSEVNNSTCFTDRIFAKVEHLKSTIPDETFPWKMVIFISTGICGILLIFFGILWIIFLNETIAMKTRHIQKITDKMMEKDKLAVLGKLAGQISHELRTPLSIIHNSVYLLRREGAENRELFEPRLVILENKIKLCSNILESMLSYSRIKAHLALAVSLQKCLEEVIHHMNIPSKIKTTISFKKENPFVVFIDYHQLYSVLRNMILNSVQAMGDTGKLTIDVAPTNNGKTITVRIHDTGRGITKNSRNKIFNLFYSSKITRTGLGLPISKSIIEANNGRLYLEETSQKGSCFVIELEASPKKEDYPKFTPPSVKKERENE